MSIKYNKTITLRLTKENIQYLRELAHKISLERKLDLSASDLIREATEKMFPLNIKGE